jgi:hypothetical protein
MLVGFEFYCGHVISVVAPCIASVVCHCYEGISCLHLQGRDCSETTLLLTVRQSVFCRARLGVYGRILVWTLLIYCRKSQECVRDCRNWNQTPRNLGHPPWGVKVDDLNTIRWRVRPGEGVWPARTKEWGRRWYVGGGRESALFRAPDSKAASGERNSPF